jgi:hypothetical protein
VLSPRGWAIKGRPDELELAALVAVLGAVLAKRPPETPSETTMIRPRRRIRSVRGWGGSWAR